MENETKRGYGKWIAAAAAAVAAVAAAIHLPYPLFVSFSIWKFLLGISISYY